MVRCCTVCGHTTPGTRRWGSEGALKKVDFSPPPLPPAAFAAGISLRPLFSPPLPLLCSLTHLRVRSHHAVHLGLLALTQTVCHDRRALHHLTRVLFPRGVDLGCGGLKAIVSVVPLDRLDHAMLPIVAEHGTHVSRVEGCELCVVVRLLQRREPGRCCSLVFEAYFCDAAERWRVEPGRHWQLRRGLQGFPRLRVVLLLDHALKLR